MTKGVSVKQILATIINNSEVMPGVYRVELESAEFEDAQPGQFAMVGCGEENLLRRPMSIHRLTNKGGKTELALLYKVVGKGTQWLSERQPGEKLDLLLPLGNGFAINPASHNLLLLAGGIGIAPIYFLAQRAVKAGHSVRLILGSQTARQLYPPKLLPPQVELVTVTEDGSAGRKGKLTDHWLEFTKSADQVFACGPLPMYAAMARQISRLNQKPVYISLEVRMGCGLGICYSCTVKTRQGLKQVCTDGPVFALADILWGELGLS